jgi:hypothetical protein
MPTAAEHIAAIYVRLDKIESQIKAINITLNGIESGLDQEIDLPLPLAQPIPKHPLRGVQGVGNGGDDLEDLSADERAAVEAARQRLAADQGGVIEDVIPEGQRATSDGEHVDLPPVSDEQREARRRLAFQIGLENDFGVEGIDTYVKGGPLWLYYGNRDYVLGLSKDVQTAMVEDVMQTSPAEAVEMGRDLFKARGDEARGTVPEFGSGF